MMHRYEMLNPQFESLLLNGAFKEIITRRYRPFELELFEATGDGELVYLEHIAKSIHH